MHPTALSGRLLVQFCRITWRVQLSLEYRNWLSADRRATARTMETQSHAAIREKKNTRVRSLCIIMGLLDVKGLPGATTVIGSLMLRLVMCSRGKPTFICTTTP